MKKAMVTVLLGWLLLPVFGENRLSERGFELTWELRGERLVATLTAPTTGWIAWGTGATNKMKDADMLLLWIDDATGIPMGEDHFGTGPFTHKADRDLGGSRDVQILSGLQTDEATTVTFSLPLDSGDRYDTLLERGKSYPLILAAGKSDNIRRKHNLIYKGTLRIP